MKQFKNSKIKRVIEYFVIALLSVCINITGYNVATDVVKEEIKQNKFAAAKEVALIGDNYIDNIYKNLYSLLSSNAVKGISSKETTQEKRREYCELLLNEMNSFSLVQSTFEDVGNTSKPIYSVMFKESELCVQSDYGIMDFSLAYTSAFDADHKNYEQWIDSIYSQKGIHYNLISGSKKPNKLMIVYYIPGIDKEVAAVAWLDGGYYKNLFSRFANEGEIISLINGSGKVVFTNIERESFGKDVFLTDSITINGEQYLTNIVDSNFNDFYYITCSNERLYFEKLHSIRTAFIFSYIFCLIVGLLISYLLAVINSKKETELLNKTQQYKKETIESELKNLIIGVKGLNKKEQYNKIMLTENNSKFVLVMFEAYFLEEDKVAYPGEDALKKIDEWIKTKMKFYSDGSDVYFFEIYGDAFVVVQLADKTVSSFAECLKELYIDSKNNFNVELRFIVSKPENNYFKIKDLYNQVMSENLNNLLENDIPVYLYSDEVKRIEEHLYSEELEEKLLAFLNSGYTEQAIEIVEELLKKAKNSSLTSGKFLVSQLIVTLSKVASHGDNISEFNERFEDYYNSTFYYKIHERILNYVRDICESIKPSCSDEDMRNSKINRCKNIKEYIDEHFYDPALNVNAIALKFDVSRSYLSQEFKRAYGENISDYIVKCRIEMAKKLLADGLSNRKIAQMVGFTTEVVYYRAFKKYENITPSEYRTFLSINAKSE